MRNSLRVTLCAVAIAISASGCSKKHDAEKTAAAPVAVVKGVTVETVKAATVPELLDVVGSVKARTSAVVSPRVPGSISVLKVREGDRVKKGQLLMQLDAQEQQAGAAVATAAIDEARRGLDEAQSRKKLAEATFERYHKLFNEQAISRQEFDVKQSEKEVAQQGVARAESRLKQAQEGAKASATMSDYTKIVAPIAGIVASKPADLGASVFPGQPLLTIEDDSNYQLELALPEARAAQIKPGAVVQVTLDAVGSSLTARIAEIVPTADPLSRTFVAKINLTQKGLKSGMFGRGAVQLAATVTTLTVPKKALQERGALTSLWVVDKDNSVRLRIVKIGRQQGDRVEILAGLSEGERVVSAGTEKLSDGAKIE